MQYWHFSECAYPDLPDPTTYDSVRVTLPNGVIDPEHAAGLWDRYIREWQVADECGLNVMVNEHHSTATCMNSAAPLIAGVLARVTSKARILILGNPVANRNDPVRIAEEMALVDLLSHGRLDIGFVRGVQYEVGATNSKPFRMTERMWEAIELITRAMVTHDGPFNWEGEFFHHRQVNIWPRPYQQPSPPIWIATGTPASAAPVADHGYKIATFLGGAKGTRKLFQAYRDRLEETGKPPAGDDMFGYAALAYTGRTDAEGLEGARKLLWYLHSNKVGKQFTFPPGYMPYFVRAAALRGPSAPGAPAVSPIPDLTSMSVEDLIDQGILFAGSAKTVAGQIERFYNEVGGLGHLLLMGQAGHLGHEETIRGIERFEASRVAGAGIIKTNLRIVVPLLRSSIGGAAALMFVLLTHEFTASLLVRSAKTQVMGTVLYDTYANGNYPQVAAVAMVMTVVTFTGVVIALSIGGPKAFEDL